MEDKIEIILVGAILEFIDTKVEFIPKCLHSAMSIFMDDKSIFEKIPEKVIKSSEDFEKLNKGRPMTGLGKDWLTNKGQENDKEIEYFDKNGVLIYDGIHASAFGRMNYFYRSKGIRLYLLEDKTIMTVCPYSYIDHQGFSFVQEEVDKTKFKKIKTADEVQQHLGWTREDPNDRSKIKVNEQLIKMLTSIKKPFHRDYYLEYLLTPPDVDKISDFSENIRLKFWDVCLSKRFKKNWGKEMQENAISFLSYLKIPPSPIQILEFIKRKSKGAKLDEILEKIDNLQDNLTNQKEDIFEFKPNIGGVGINLNELNKRIAKKFNL
ncbi:hypothetical protein [Flavobacterium sp. ASW18X]|uniref:hypothetical protein n=1 Tax=Flavobacterium sp. ASW18X TaxID=2572595 RepID=UPI0010AE417A|nr:hypothetical protein [Flavobacterium sp. ASW18X]TKD61437.1 hypothetical protein FBT53_11700 [Flavobacterium sp. ASW18X]